MATLRGSMPPSWHCWVMTLPSNSSAGWLTSGLTRTYSGGWKALFTDGWLAGRGGWKESGGGHYQPGAIRISHQERGGQCHWHHDFRCRRQREEAASITIPSSAKNGCARSTGGGNHARLQQSPRSHHRVRRSPLD